MAAWAAGGIWFQSSTGIGGTGGMLTFYGRWRTGQQGVNGYVVGFCRIADFLLDKLPTMTVR
jgi:hypothetical protein